MPVMCAPPPPLTPCNAATEGLPSNGPSIGTRARLCPSCAARAHPSERALNVCARPTRKKQFTSNADTTTAATITTTSANITTTINTIITTRTAVANITTTPIINITTTTTTTTSATRHHH